MLNEYQYLAVGRNGKYSSKGTYQSDLEQVENLVDYLIENNIDELVLYFHGGLVSEISGAAAVQGMIDGLSITDSQRHVMGILWKTGLKEVLSENLIDIFSSKQGKNLLRWVLKIASKKLKANFGAKSLGDGEGFSLEQIDEQIKRCEPGHKLFEDFDIKFHNEAKGIDFTEQDFINSAQIDLELMANAEPNFKSEWEDLPKRVKVQDELLDDRGAKGLFNAARLAKAIGKIAYKVIKRFLQDTDHGLHATVVEEICREYYISDAGQWVWGEMKDKAEQMWDISDGPCRDLFELLHQKIPGINVQLIGHSAGSICVSHLLGKKEERNWNINVEQIFWLAPAARSDLFKTAIIDHVERFESFRMFTMTDHFELKDTLLPSFSWIYPSSLLYLISGILEEESDCSLSGMDRFHKGNRPYGDAFHKAIKEFLEVAERKVLSPSLDSAPNGFKTKSLTHGGFDNDFYTIESIAHAIRP